MTQNQKDNISTLRDRAEKLLRQHSDDADTVRSKDLTQLVHELQVHQIELELQNEELRQTQTRLEENRVRYLNLYHNAPVGYIILSQAGMVKESNATFANMVGLQSPQIHGKPFADFLVTDDQAIFRARLRTFFKQPTDKHIELRLKTRENVNRYVDLAATLQNSHESSKKQYNELLVTVTDVTARVEAEKSLQQSQDYIVSIINSLASHICVLDGHGTIILVNKAWRIYAAENSPVKGDLAEGANYLSVCDSTQGDEKETAHLFAAGIRAILMGERETFSLEYPCHSLTGARWFIGTATKLIDDNAYGKIVVAHKNITEIKQLEQEQLYLHDQMKQIDKAESLGIMAGAIAHNFNNILAAVIGNLELILDRQQDRKDVTPTAKDALSAAWRASELSRLMLTYLGQNVEDTQSVDFTSICNEDFHLLKLAKPSEITLTTNFPTPGPPVRVNSKQIKQIVSNLVINAWESMGNKSGNIYLAIDIAQPTEIIKKYRFPVDWQPQEKNYACLTVRDNGAGISDEDIGKIFDPFFTSKFTGRGMGLSVVLGILRSYKGAITVESQSNGGAVFKIYIPLASP